MTKTAVGDLYDYPRYYDLVFGSDWKAEFSFLEKCFEKYASGKVRRLFEPACGTGRLMYRLAQAGYEVSGVDLNERAVEYCNARLVRNGFAGSAFVGDMADFNLPRKVDAAFNTINSFRHLSSEQSARAHLRCVSEALRVGGLYVIGLHLTPTTIEPTDEESWSARRGHLCVNTRMWNTRRDTRNRVERFDMTYDVYTPTKSFQLAGELVLRTYTVTQFQSLLNSVPELEVAGIYDFAYRIDQPIELDSNTEDVIFVLKKRG